MTRGCTGGETLVTGYLFDGNGVLVLPPSRQRVRVTCSAAVQFAIGLASREGYKGCCGATEVTAVTDFRFGRFELDSRTRELRKDGVRLRLQDQPFAVLAVMLEHPGELLTRDELRDRLWPNGTFVDFEHGLNAAVKRLRSVLGDNAERPRFVETLHRRGYRFIARVERVNGAGGAATGRTGRRQAAARRPALQPPRRGERAGVVRERADRRAHDAARPPVRRPARRHRALVVSHGSSAPTARCAKSATRFARTTSSRARSARKAIACASRRSSSKRAARPSCGPTRSSGPPSDSLLVQSDVATQIVRSVAVELLPDRAPTPSARHAQRRRVPGLPEGPLSLESAGRRGHPRMPGLLRAGPHARSGVRDGARRAGARHGRRGGLLPARTARGA